MAFRGTSTSLQSVLLLAFRDYGSTTSATPGTATAMAPSVACSTLTRVGTLATFTATAAHRLVSGQEVTIAGANKTQFNGRFLIIVTSATVFSYVITDDPGANATGTITAVYTPMAQWALIKADGANTADISFGSNGQGDFDAIPAGGIYELKNPMGAKFDLSQFFVKSTGASQTWRVLFV